MWVCRRRQDSCRGIRFLRRLLSARKEAAAAAVATARGMTGSFLVGRR
ncbi:hypothetical protein LINPERPRIM_LOCUS4471 [Linum perenne]